MAIVKMKRLRAIALAPKRDELLLELQRLGCVELSAQDDFREDPALAQRYAPDHGDVAECQARRQSLREGLAVLDRWAPRKTPMLAAKPTASAEDLLDQAGDAPLYEFAGELTRLGEQLKALASEESREKLKIETLLPWKDCALPLDHPGTAHVAVLFGTLPAGADMDALSKELQDELDGAVQLDTVSTDSAARYVSVLYLRDDSETVLRLLREHGFMSPSFGDAKGTAKEGISGAEQNLKDIDRRRTATLEKITQLGAQRDALQLAYDRAEVAVSRAEAAEKLLRGDSTLLLSGWCPAEREKDVTALLEKFDCAYEFTEPEKDEYPKVPVKLKNGPITRSLQTVTDMYALPAYGTVDPNPLMAPFFIFFYGMMMADMGYGLLMILACLVVLKKKRPANKAFWELFLWCGVATFIWGIFTASFFGDATTQVYLMSHEALPDGMIAYWFWQPLIIPTNHALQLLIGSLALGVIQIFTGMAVSIYMKCKRGEVMSALTDEVAWYLILIALAVGILTKQMTVALIVIIVLLVISGAYGKKGFGIFTGIFGGLYNHVTGYFSDILSYSRLMALMLAGAVIAQVFNQLGALIGNIVGFLIISIIGNALNMGLNLLGCYVHDMRLQCLEFFGRFYEDGGKTFEPLTMKPKYVDLEK